MKTNKTYFIGLSLFFLFAIVNSFAQTNTITFQEKNNNVIGIDKLLELLDSGQSIANKTLIINEVNFEFGESILTEEARLYLNKVVRLLKAINTMNLTIAGHTDNVGNSETNLQLSKERAISVYYYLIENGISSTRLSHNGFGDKNPIADNRNDQGRERNRRVEFGISQSQQHKTSGQMQDMVYLKDGTQFGAYDVHQDGTTLYYTRFSDGVISSILMGDVASFQLANGQIQNTTSLANPATTKTTKPSEDYYKPASTWDEGSFLYQFRYFDFFYGINFAKLSTSTDFVSERNWFGRIGFGLDFFHTNSLVDDTTKFAYRVNQFFRKTHTYLRVETALSNQGGIFRDRAGFFENQDVYFTLSYFETTFLAQTSFARDNINFHIGTSLMLKYDEDYLVQNEIEEDTKFVRFFDIPIHIGMFFRMPHWDQDFKLGFRYSFGLIDTTRNKNKTGNNLFVYERNFNRNFSVSLKYGI
ncbi:MAG: OmpA family protein [Crocinitomix sp.]|nr:OmpA family protein [Crocinitomix sp.]